jgi:hypothetical protein
VSKKNEKLGCIVCQNVATLGVRKKMWGKICKASYEIAPYGEL